MGYKHVTPPGVKPAENAPRVNAKNAGHSLKLDGDGQEDRNESDYGNEKQNACP